MLVLLVAMLSFMPPQLKFEVARTNRGPDLNLVESQDTRIPPTQKSFLLPAIEPSQDVALVHADLGRVGLNPKHEPQNSITFSTSLFGIWLVGVFFLMLQWIAIAWKTRGVCKRSFEIAGVGQNTVSDLSAKLGIRRIPSVLRAEVASPCLAYCPSPTILLPLDFDASTETSRAVFAHELAHLKRRDWQWNLIFVLLHTVLWFHPFVWKIRSTHMNDCENACDDLAAELTGGRSAYQQVLAQVALAHVNDSVVVGLSMVRKPEIIRRLQRLGLPVADFSLKRWIAVISTTAVVTSTIATLGLAYIDGSLDEEEAKVISNEYSIQVANAVDDLKGATVEFQWYHTGNRKAITRKASPDKEGWVRGVLGTDPLSNVTMVCRVPGCVPYAITRHSRNRSIVLPKQKSIHLEKSRSLSGLVRDSEGKPIKDALVRVDMASQDSWDQSRHFTVENAKTDAKGKWTIKTAPWNLKAAKVNIRISHPEYLPTWGSVPEYPEGEPGSKATMLRGVQLTGAVVNERGEPVEGVRVTLGHQQSGILPRPPDTSTDSMGRFELKKCRPGLQFVVASKDGFAPELVELTVAEGDAAPDELNLVLKPGKKIKARLHDQNGDPVVDAYVAIQSWRKDHSLGFHTRTDAEGRFEWHDAPEDDVWFTFSGKEHRLIVFHKLNHSDVEHEVLLYTRQKVSLNLVDSETNALIQDAHAMRGLKFSADNPKVSWDGSWVPFVDGEAKFTFRRSVPETWLKINAPGYETHIEKFLLGEKDKNLTLKLKPLSEEPKTNGQLPIDQEVSILQLKKLGAEVNKSEGGVWSAKIVGPWEIPSAMLGVADIKLNPRKALWTGTLQDFQLLRSLTQVDLMLDGVHIDGEFISNLGKIESLVSLDLDECPWEISPEECGALGRLRSVRSLKLDGRWQKFPPEAIDALAKMPKLESLVFDGCGAYHMDERTLTGRLSKLVNLKQLVLNSDTGFGNAVGKEVAQLRRLESLSIRGRTLGDKFIDSISDLQLRELNLVMTGITDVGLKKIADNFPKLESLNVERTGITADGLRNAMGQFTSLRKLTVELLDDGKVLLEFKRRHLDCAIYPISYGPGSVMSHGAVKLPDSDGD